MGLGIPIHLSLLLVGLVLLVKGSDFFVAAASRIAKRLGVSHFIIGLTLVAIGTSLPELAAGITASLGGHSGIILGNVVGSNIANIGLILGITVLLFPIVIHRSQIKRDSSMLLSVILLFYAFAIDGIIGPFEAGFFVIFYISYLLFLISSKKALKALRFKDFLNYFFKLEYLTTITDTAFNQLRKVKSIAKMRPSEGKVVMAFREGIVKDLLIAAIAATAVIFGARYAVGEAVWFADFFGIPQNFIALTVIAIGTSLPELSVSLRAAKKGFGSMVIGNVMGSSIANILLILGVTGLINPIGVSQITLFSTAAFMLVISILLTVFMTRGKMGWKEGLTFVFLYLTFIVLLLFFGNS